MISVVVDIDDTLVNIQHRICSAWNHVLGHEIPQEATESLGSRQILEKFGSSDEKLWTRFQRVLFCLEEIGIELLKLDTPIPFAADILQKWSTQCTLVYLTGRPKNMRDLTLSQLEKFGFPMDHTQLVMFRLKDWENVSSMASLIRARFRTFSSTAKRHNVVRVVDDTPSFFAVYQKFSVPERIGLLHAKRYSSQDYFSQGATRVVESWKQLQGDLTKL